MQLTRQLAWAAATDAANASMRRNGRPTWSEDDLSVAIGTFEQLWPELCPSCDHHLDISRNYERCPAPVCVGTTVTVCNHACPSKTRW